ncbi:MAG: peptidase [Sorangium cellulosum]|nr:MAG: peptidase [Sorangium cellulosum]
MRRSSKPWLFVGFVALASTHGFAQGVTQTNTSTTNCATAAQDVDVELDRVNQQLQQTEADLEKNRSQIDVVRKRMIARGRTYYRMTHAGLLPLGAGFDSLMDHTSKVERLRRALQKDARASKQLQQQKLALLKQRQALVDRKQPLELKKRAMTEARAALMEAGDRRRAFDRAFLSSGPEIEDYTAVYGAPAEPDGPVAGTVGHPLEGFRSLEGRLPFPLAGRTEIRLVRRPGAGGPGVEMLAPVGTPVVAVHSGRVAFADDYGTYGNVVIIDHGEQYFSVCGELATIDVKVGDTVSSGARIGTVGRVNGKGLLYFELRQSADTLNPAPWLGI